MRMETNCPTRTAAGHCPAPHHAAPGRRNGSRYHLAKIVYRASEAKSAVLTLAEILQAGKSICSGFAMGLGESCNPRVALSTPKTSV